MLWTDGMPSGLDRKGFLDWRHRSMYVDLMQSRTVSFRLVQLVRSGGFGCSLPKGASTSMSSTTLGTSRPCWHRVASSFATP